MTLGLACATSYNLCYMYSFSTNLESKNHFVDAVLRVSHLLTDYYDCQSE